MKKTLLAFFVFTFVFGIGQVTNFQWVKQIGGLSDDNGVSIVSDDIGNVYTMGIFGGTVDFDPNSGISNLDSGGTFVLKLDFNGNYLWAKRIKAVSFSIALDNLKNIYTTGSFGGVVDFDPGPSTYTLSSVNGSGFISKLDSSGNFIWTKQFGGGALGHSIKTDNLGNVYAAGHLQGSGDFDPGPGVTNLSSSGLDDIFILKLSPSGNFIWAKQMGGPHYDLVHSMDIDNSGNVYTTGFFRDTTDFDPGPLTYTLAGINGSVFISKLDINGDFVWAKQIGSNAFDYSHALCLDKTNNVYVSGFFNYTADFDPGPSTYTLSSGLGDDAFILKLDPNGNFVWAKQFTANYPSLCIAQSMQSDKDNNIFTFCVFKGTVNVDPGISNTTIVSNSSDDVFISKLDSNGIFIWVKQMGGTSSDNAQSIDIAKDGSIYSTGNFTGTGDYDPGSGVSNIISNGGSDFFIQKLGPTAVGINEIQIKNHISVFPNPVSDFLFIKESNNPKIQDIILYNNLGQRILSTKNIESNKIDLRSVPDGIYFLEIISDDKSYYNKILIGH